MYVYVQGQSEAALGSRNKITTRIHTRKCSEAATCPTVARWGVLLQHGPAIIYYVLLFIHDGILF